MNLKSYYNYLVYNHHQKKVLSPSHLDQSLLKVLSRLNLNKLFKSLYEKLFLKEYYSYAGKLYVFIPLPKI